MTVYIDKLTLKSKGNRATYHEISDEVREIIEKSGVKNGICVVSSQHTTCSVFVEEYSHDLNYAGDEYLQVDLNNVLEKIVPRCTTEGQYFHPGPEHTEFGLKLAGDTVPDRTSLLNTDAHIKGSLLGFSEAFVVEDGEIQLGNLGYIYFVDWDHNRERERTCKVAVVGE